MMWGCTKAVTKYKLVFLGDSNVGKTSIIVQFMYGAIGCSYTPTIGLDFITRSVLIGEKEVQLQMWDTAGQERFRSLTPSYIRDSDVAVIVYDVTNADSFNSANAWIEEVRRERGHDAIIVLVGNKDDLGAKRQVTIEDGKRTAIEKNVTFFETSSKSGYNVLKVFRSIVTAIPGLFKDEKEANAANIINIDPIPNIPAGPAKKSRGLPFFLTLPSCF